MLFNTDGSYRHNKALWIKKERVTITTDSDGIAFLTSYALPIAVSDIEYVITFFNGTGSGFRYYAQFKDYYGNPVVNQTLQFYMYYIPEFDTLVSA